MRLWHPVSYLANATMLLVEESYKTLICYSWAQSHMQKDVPNAEDDLASEGNDEFSFLSEWGKQLGSAQKIRW